MNSPLRALMYFMTWGVLYGISLGAIAGTATIPLYGTGTLMGPILGLISGIIGGVITGVAAVATGSTSIDMDLDLALTRKRTARRIGLAAFFIPLLLLGLGSLIDRDVLYFGFPMLLAVPWGTLAAAYAAHRFPDVMVQKMLKSKRGDLAEYEPALESHPSLSQPISDLWQRGKPSRAMGLGLAVGLLAGVIHVLSYPNRPIREFFMPFLALGGGGLVAGGVLWLYIAVSLGTFLTFLKRLIFQDYVPHLPVNWSRTILTATAFVFTLGITWWTVIFAPLCAAFAAYATYHSLALPDARLEKTKHKEKNDLRLKNTLEIHEAETLADEDINDDEVRALSELLK